MNRLLKLILIDFKLLSKSKTFYLKLLLFPTVLILILGTVFGGSDVKLPDFTLAFCNKDSYSLGTELKSTFKNKEVSSMINIKEVSSFKRGKSLIDRDKAGVFVYVPNDFTKAAISGGKADITIIANKDNQTDKAIVKSILNRFIQNVNIILNERREVIIEGNSPNLQKVIIALQKEKPNKLNIPKVSSNNKVVPIGAMQYSSIGMVVMFSILTAFTLIHNMIDEKLNNTLSRIKSTPTLDIQYALGKLTGISLAVTLQMLIVILITSLIFKMRWGNAFYIILITMIYSFTIGSAITLFGFIAKDHISVSSIASPILYGFSFFGGSFISKDSLPKSFQAIQQIIPNGKAINCYLAVCEGRGIKDIYIDLIELILMGIILLVIAIKIYNGRKWANNANSNNDKKTIKAAV